MMRSRIATLGVVGFFVTLTAAWAQQHRSDVSSLTPLDYHEIQQQVARSAHGYDSAADRGYLYARAFATDGVFVDSTGKSYEGREKLAELARQDPDSQKGPSYVSHFVLSTAIDPAPYGATAKSYVMITTTPVRLPSPKTIRAPVTDGGQFWDQFVKTAEGWRIQKRTFYRAGMPIPASMPAPERRSGGAAPVTSPSQVHTPSSTSKEPIPVLTADDYTEIEELYAHYGYGVDSGEEQGYIFANSFTPDGLHINEANPLEKIKGREALAAFVHGDLRISGAVQFTKGAGRANPTMISHHTANVMLDPVPGGVNAKVYLMYVTIAPEGQPNQVGAGGIYFDFIVKTSEGWKFKQKDVLFLGVPVPDSLPASFKSQTTSTSR